MSLLQRTPHLLLEPREEHVLDLASVLSGAPRLSSVVNWYVRTATADGEHALSAAGVSALGQLPPSELAEREILEQRFGADLVSELLAAGVLVEVVAAGGDNALSGWHPLAAIAHRHLRWRGVDSETAAAALQRSTQDPLDRLGPPPPLTLDLCPPARRLSLPSFADDSALDALARHRATGRNFHPGRALSLQAFSRMMRRTYGALAVSETSGCPVMKRASASAGSLHAVEAFLLVQNVESLQPGLYHYHPVEHALQPLRALDASTARAQAALFVAQQPWFVDAAVMVILVARFARNFWKYRNHAKTYRALILDAGHLSHHQYLVATELGLAAFITAAVNEGDIEDAFGLDPMQEGVIAVTGFGWRGERMEVLEFDPLKQVWPEWTPE